MEGEGQMGEGSVAILRVFVALVYFCALKSLQVFRLLHNTKTIKCKLHCVLYTVCIIYFILHSNYKTKVHMLMHSKSLS